MEYGIQQGYNPLTSTAYASQPYASQFGQPAVFGGATAPFSGLMGSGIPGLFGGQNIGRQPGQVVDGIGGMFQTSNVDPLTAAHVQHVQLAHQLQLAQQQLAQLLQQAQVAQQQIAHQRAQLGQQVGLAPGLGIQAFNNPLNHPLNRLDPITAAYVQQAQVAQLCQQLGQQAQFGNPYGQPGQAWPGIGQNLWANPQLSQFGRNLPLQYGLGGGFGGQLPIY